MSELLTSEIKDCLENGAGTCRNVVLIDELRAELARRDEELAELNDKAVFIQFENEDELPADISGNVYDVMFRCSHVDGVRLFPYIEENGQKYFLVMLKEEE